MKRILVVEDDRNISQLLQMYLKKEGYEVTPAYDGGEAYRLFEETAPDLVLLDIMLPVMDGYGVLALIREKGDTPVILLTAKSETEDKVGGLRKGADDYITKPFEMREVIARVEAVLRRGQSTANKARKLVFENLSIDMEAMVLEVRGEKVATPLKEMELLYHLASAPNKVFTRNQLLDEVWGISYFGDSRTVDVHIKRLREKLEGVSEQWSLETVWRVGYKFEVRE